jgi:sugar phosphate isomerase/epimerase
MIIAGSITFDDYPLEDALARIRACGFDGVEIWQPHLAKCRTPALLSRFRREASELGLELFGLNVIGFDWFQPYGTDAELAATLQQLKNDIDYAAALGVKDVMIWEGIRPERAGRNVLMQRCLPRLLQLLGEALPYANDRGLNILCEPHPFTVAIEDWFAIELYDRLGAPNFGYIYDCCHYGVGRPDDYAEAIRNLEHRIRHIHFADSDMTTSELHFPPGEGAMDLDAVVDAFVAIGYQGTISLDLYGWPLPERGAAIGIPYLKRVIERLGLGKAKADMRSS